ncbi:hypothetical protein [Streptomyces sp. NPDC091027]|uniref:hypothetical protein n=1 Tax=Streptomyces sp. NPDC091027 TaxID=3365971 RepID=UPI0037F4B78D
MTTQPNPEDLAREAKRRRAGIAAFLVGTAVSLAVGALARWAYRAWTGKSLLPPE